MGAVGVPVLGSDGRPLLAMLSIGRIELDEEYLRLLAEQMLSLAHKMSEQLILMGDMPKPSNEFARYNLEQKTTALNTGTQRRADRPDDSAELPKMLGLRPAYGAR